MHIQEILGSLVLFHFRFCLQIVNCKTIQILVRRPPQRKVYLVQNICIYKFNYEIRNFFVVQKFINIEESFLLKNTKDAHRKISSLTATIQELIPTTNF